MSFKKIHVYDIDGVLLDSEHRHRFLSNGALDVDYYFQEQTPEGLQLDTLLPHAHQYKRDCKNPKIYTILCSARSNEEKHISSIKKKLGLPNKLLLVGETQPPLQSASKLKRRALQRIFNLKQFRHLPSFFWDDSLDNLTATVDLFTKVFYIPSQLVDKRTS